MISAEEASNLVSLSDLELTKILGMIGDEITKLATDGKRSINLSQSFSSWRVFDVNKRPYQGLILSPLQKKIKQAFMDKGYSFIFSEHTFDRTKQFGYMADDNEVSIMDTTYFFEIKW